MAPYLHDVFVSYSSIDRSWVDRFAKDLEAEVSARTGRHVPIWWDRQNIGPGDDWNRRMLEDARRSRVFIPVVSPSCLHSDPCQRQLAAFHESAQPESLFPVILLPIEPDAQPPEIRQATQVLFHKRDHGIAHPLTGQLRNRELGRLAQAIADRVASRRRAPRQTLPTDELVAATRERIAPNLLEKCGWMRILNMSLRIDSAQVYTEVNVLAGVRAKQLRSIA